MHEKAYLGRMVHRDTQLGVDVHRMERVGGRGTQARWTQMYIGRGLDTQDMMRIVVHMTVRVGNRGTQVGVGAEVHRVRKVEVHRPGLDQTYTRGVLTEIRRT